MSVYKPKSSPYFQYDFWITLGEKRGRYYGSTRCRKIGPARRYEERRKIELTETYIRGGNRVQMTLDSAALKYYREVQDRPNSKTIKTMCGRFAKIIGKEMLLSEMTDSVIDDYVARRRGQKRWGRKEERRISNATVNRELKVLAHMMNRARKAWGVDVAEVNWGDQRKPEPRERVRELTATEETRLFGKSGEHTALIRFALLTGMRRNNCLFLKWSEIDGDVIRVKTKGNKYQLFPIEEDLRAVIYSQAGNHQERVFTFICGKKRGERLEGMRLPYTVDGWKEQWRGIIEAAKIEDFRFHDLRHTFATRFIRRTGNLVALQELLGHADITTTRKYIHVNQGDLRALLRNSTEAETEKQASA